MISPLQRRNVSGFSPATGGKEKSHRIGGGPADSLFDRLIVRPVTDLSDPDEHAIDHVNGCGGVRLAL